LNFGLSPDFSVHLKVSLSESLSERLSQKLKWPNLSTGAKFKLHQEEIYYVQEMMYRKIATVATDT